ncbi:MAG: acyl-(acyl-carrier-protein)--UDP-N-acetylglucosamine O-acyltransferase [Planctomycetota bacterium]|nr:acyl-(acyl-carrier-protein)--UDP-N-acetylglucosamine O-acyltransferase [Planctomycetota bacterium]
MAISIADTACVDPRAELADDVEVGPYCVVGPDVRIGRGTRLVGHVCLLGVTTLGEFNTISPFVVIGGDPQDVSYQGTPTRVEVGDHNIIREGVTVNRATEKEDGVTRIGSHCFLMATSHVAHDCKLGNRITIANGSMLGGHVHVEDYASISGGVAVHHYVSIGGYSFVGGQSRINHDVPRYMLVDGNPSKVRCINVVGLKRNGVTAEGVDALHEAHRLIYRAKMSLKHATEILESHGHMTAEVKNLLSFIQAQHEGKHGRGRERFRKGGKAASEE